MKYAYVQGWCGNGFEDAGSGVTCVKLFASKQDAVAHSIKKFLETACEFLDKEDVEEQNIYEIAEKLNGEVDEGVGYWSVQPESSAFGHVVETE